MNTTNLQNTLKALYHEASINQLDLIRNYAVEAIIDTHICKKDAQELNLEFIRVYGEKIEQGEERDLLNDYSVFMMEEIKKRDLVKEYDKVFNRLFELSFEPDVD